MVGVASGSLQATYSWTHSPGHLESSEGGGRLAPFCIHHMNRVNFKSGLAMMREPLTSFEMWRTIRRGRHKPEQITEEEEPHVMPRHPRTNCY